MTFFQAPYLEIKKQMDKQDPLAHPLLQWYTILVFLFIKTASFSTACFKRGGGRGEGEGPILRGLQCYSTTSLWGLVIL